MLGPAGSIVEHEASPGLFQRCVVVDQSDGLLLRRDAEDAEPFQAPPGAVRPQPPDVPSGFLGQLKVGQVVEASTADGWARGTWLEPVLGSAAPLSVQLLAEGGEVSVSEADVRPALDWVEGTWRPAADESAPKPDEAPPTELPAKPAQPPVEPAPEAAPESPPPAAAPPASGAPPDKEEEERVTPSEAPSGAEPTVKTQTSSTPEVDSEVARQEPPTLSAEEVGRIFATGSSVEVTSFADGLRGSWYSGLVVESPTARGAVRVRYTGSNTEEEEVSVSRLRPEPPEVLLSEWKALACADTALELYFQQGWWDVVVAEVKKTCIAVVAPEYAKRHTVPPTKLRPRWSFDPASRHEPSGGWSLSVGGTSYALAAWREQAAALAAEANAAAEAERAAAAAASRPPEPLSAAEAEAAAAAVAAEAESEAAAEASLDGDALSSRVSFFRFGCSLEFRPVEEEYLGGWVPAEVLKLCPESNELLLGRVDAAGNTASLRETCRVARCRPPPPPLGEAASAGWQDGLAPGDAVEVWLDGVWWQARVDGLAQLAGSSHVTVVSPQYGSRSGTRHRAPLSHVRPRYCWLSPDGGWTYSSSGGATVELAPTEGDKDREHTFPAPPRGGEKRAAAPQARSATARGSGGSGGSGGSRRGRSGAARARAAAAAPAPALPPSGELPSVGEVVEVEVAEEGAPDRTVWSPSEVRESVPGGRFKACVNGDEDFIEEFGLEDEGREWRKVEDQASAKKTYAAAHALAKRKAAAEKAAEKAAAEAAARTAAAGADKGEGKAERKGEKGESKGEGGPKPKKRKVTASGGAPRPPPGVVVSHRYAFGMAVEVAGEDEGFERSWYSGEVLKTAAKVTVRYDALFEEDSDAKRPLTETLEPGRLRPIPPKAQEGWLRKAKVGLPLELKHDGGWWQVEFVSVADGGDAETATQLLVRGAGELWGGAEILADVSSLRPGWHFNAASQSWGSRGAAAAAPPNKSRSGSKSRRSGARPDKGAA